MILWNAGPAFFLSVMVKTRVVEVWQKRTICNTKVLQYKLCYVTQFKRVYSAKLKYGIIGALIV